MTTSATPRGLLLGTAAESYERFRLGYPDEVVDRTLGYAGRPVESAVEVGAGTGKATRAFASRGIRVTALEPDQGMFTVLERETYGMPVSPVQATFEQYAGEPTDLVYAAASWHWTDPATRWTRTADLLAPGGVVAVFGGPMKVADPEVQEAVADASRLPLDDPAFRPSGGETPEVAPWPATELDGSELFADAEDHVLAREVVVPQKEYVGYLSTLSVCLQLAPADREGLLRRIAAVVPDQVRLDLAVRLFLARRV